MNLGKKGIRKQIKKNTSSIEKTRSRIILSTITAFLVGLLLVGCVVMAIGIGMIKGILDDAPLVSKEDIIPKEETSLIYDSNGDKIDILVQAGSNRTNIKEGDFNTLPRHLINAFIAVEDSRFYHHNGIDLKGIVRAAVVGITHGFHFSEGGSTITQQLIKNNVFTDWMSENSLGDRLQRKIQEQYLAVQLEKIVDKDTILLQYLNTINLGNNTLGIAKASERYFSKPYTELTLTESAVLAAITNNPSAYNPIRHPENNFKRVQKILDAMEEQELISKEEHNQVLKEANPAQEDNIYSKIRDNNTRIIDTEDVPNSYFVDAVIQQVSEDLQTERGYTQQQATHMLYSGGLRIYTTLVPSVQKIIEEEVNNESHYAASQRQYSCTFTLKVTHADGSVNIYNENDLRQYFRKKKPTFKLISDSKEGLREYIREFRKTVYHKKKGDTVEPPRISYTLQPQVSFVLMDQHTGYVLGIVGGRGNKETSLSLNRATNGAVRQPGSLFKVLAGFTPALDTCGDTLGTVYYDGPYAIGEKEFKNWWQNGYMGYSTIRQSIEYSMNIISVRCLNETVTPALAFEYLEDYGFTTLVESRTDSKGRIFTDINASLSLGGLTDGVTNLETTAAFATIANEGIYTKPVFYTKIMDSDGNVIIDNTIPQTHTVMKKTTAFLLTDAMKSVMNGASYPNSGNVSLLEATGKAASFDGMPLAGKTGTTTGTYDLWFAGFSPYYTATIWSGYDEMQEIRDYSTTNYHKDIWKSIMQRVHFGLPYKDFKAPAGIIAKQICCKSGKLAIDGVCDKDPRGSMSYIEYFAEGTEPTEVCDKHVGITVCQRTNLRATEHCPQTSTQVYISLDSTATGDSDDSAYALKSLANCHIDHVAESRSIAESQLASQRASEAASRAESAASSAAEQSRVEAEQSKAEVEHQQQQQQHNNHIEQPDAEPPAVDNNNNNGYWTFPEFNIPFW